MSEPEGSWNTAVSDCRTARISLRRSPARERPSNSIVPAVDLRQAEDGIGDRRLARAGLADEAERLAAADGERDPVDGADDGAVPGVEVLVDPCHLEERGRAHRGGTSVGTSVRRALPLGREMACRHAFADDHVGGHLDEAERLARAAAGVEHTTRRERGRRRRVAGDRRDLVGEVDVEPAHRVEERLGVRVERVQVDGEHVRALDDPSGVHHVHPIAEPGRDAEVVGDQEHADPAFRDEVVEEGEDASLGRDVERRRRLVGDQHLGVAAERHRDHDALSHPSRELVRVGVDPGRRLAEPDLPEQLDRTRAGSGLGQRRVEPDRLDQLVPDPEDGVECRERVLVDHRHATAADLGQLALAHASSARCRPPREIEPPATHERVAQQAHQREGRDRLAAPRLAHERQPLASAGARS